jgi:menaquinone-dependent protoporphyrinogen oxidase
MRTAIVYASKHGTTEKVANQIKSQLNGGEVILFNIEKAGKLEFRAFDRILIGSSVYRGLIQPSVRKFVERNMVELLQKEVGIFVCCMFFEKADQQIRKSFPEVLCNHAKSIQHVGGEFLFEKMNFVERFLVEKITGKKNTVYNLDNEKIKKFITEIES